MADTGTATVDSSALAADLVAAQAASDNLPDVVDWRAVQAEASKLAESDDSPAEARFHAERAVELARAAGRSDGNPELSGRLAEMAQDHVGRARQVVDVVSDDVTWLRRHEEMVPDRADLEQSPEAPREERRVDVKDVQRRAAQLADSDEAPEEVRQLAGQAVELARSSAASVRPSKREERAEEAQATLARAQAVQAEQAQAHEGDGSGPGAPEELSERQKRQRARALRMFGCDACRPCSPEC